MGGSQTKTLYECLKNETPFFISLLEKANIQDLNYKWMDNSYITVFAPTDIALYQLLKSIGQSNFDRWSLSDLQGLLKHHIVYSNKIDYEFNVNLNTQAFYDPNTGNYTGNPTNPATVLTIDELKAMKFQKCITCDNGSAFIIDNVFIPNKLTGNSQIASLIVLPPPPVQTMPKSSVEISQPSPSISEQPETLQSTPTMPESSSVEISQPSPIRKVIPKPDNNHNYSIQRWLREEEKNTQSKYSHFLKILNNGQFLSSLRPYMTIHLFIVSDENIGRDKDMKSYLETLSNNSDYFSATNASLITLEHLFMEPKGTKNKFFIPDRNYHYSTSEVDKLDFRNAANCQLNLNKIANMIVGKDVHSFTDGFVYELNGFIVPGIHCQSPHMDIRYDSGNYLLYLNIH